MSIVVTDHHAVKCVAIWLLATSLACASHQSTGRAPCALRADDAVFAATGEVFRECSVDRPARLSTNSIHPDWSPTPSRTGCYFVDLEFVVDTAGKPETATARAIKTNERDLADAYLATLSQWKYEPAQRGGTKVRQIITEHRAAQVGRVVVAGTAGSPRSTRPPPTAGPAC